MSKIIFTLPITLLTKLYKKLPNLTLITIIYSIMVTSHTWHYFCSQFEVILVIFRLWVYTIWRVILRFWFRTTAQSTEAWYNNFIQSINFFEYKKSSTLYSTELRSGWEGTGWFELSHDFLTKFWEFIETINLDFSSNTTYSLLLCLNFFILKYPLYELKLWLFTNFYNKTFQNKYFIKILLNLNLIITNNPINTPVVNFVRILIIRLVTIRDDLLNMSSWFRGLLLSLVFLYRKYESVGNKDSVKSRINFKFQFRNLNYYSLPESILFIVMKRFNLINFILLCIPIFIFGVYRFY